MANISFTPLVDSVPVTMTDINNNFTAINTFLQPQGDRILSTTQADIWTIQKFESGVMTCVGQTAPFPQNPSSPHGALFILDIEEIAFLPAGFVTRPVVLGIVESDTGVNMLNIWQSSTNMRKIGGTLIATLTGVRNVSFNLYAVGRWQA